MSRLSDLVMVIDWLAEKKTPTGPIEAALERLRAEAARSERCFLSDGKEDAAPSGT